LNPRTLIASLAAKRHDTFWRNNAIFFVGSIGVSFLNYLYYPVLGRLLSLESFGELQVLISFFTQITIFIGVLTMISTNIVLNEKNTDVTNRTVNELEKFTLHIGYGLLVLVTLASPLLRDTLKFESALPFILIMLVFVAGISLGFKTAYLRGKNDYMATTIEGALASITKLLASAGLVALGLQTAGAAGGILVAQLIALAYATYKAKQHGYKRSITATKPDWSVLRPQARYAGLVLFVSLIVTLQYSADVTIVKYLFSPEVAGQYASIATISRIVLFLTGSFAVVLLSSVTLSRPPAENSRLLIKSFIITALLGGSAALVFAAFPTFVVHVLFGTKYDTLAHLLPLLSFAMFAMSLNNLLATYHIALRHYGVMLYVGLGALATVVAIVISHGDPAAIVRGLAIGSAVMLAGLLGWTGYRAGYSLR